VIYSSGVLTQLVCGSSRPAKTWCMNPPKVLPWGPGRRWKNRLIKEIQKVIVSLHDSIYCSFSALTLLVGLQEGHPACKNVCFKILCEAVKGSGWGHNLKYHVDNPTCLLQKTFAFCPVRMLRIRITGDRIKKATGQPNLGNKVHGKNVHGKKVH